MLLATRARQFRECNKKCCSCSKEKCEETGEVENLALGYLLPTVHTIVTNIKIRLTLYGLSEMRPYRKGHLILDTPLSQIAASLTLLFFFSDLLLMSSSVCFCSVDRLRDEDRGISDLTRTSLEDTLQALSDPAWTCSENTLQALSSGGIGAESES